MANPEIIMQTRQYPEAFPGSSSSNRPWISNQDYSTSKPKDAWHGNDFQLKLLMLYAYKGMAEYEASFRLATEIAKADEFDDLVLRYKNRRGDKEYNYRFLQAKHKLYHEEHKSKNKISINDLKTSKNGIFSLQMYFISYLKNKEEFKDGVLEDFIICTNIGFGFAKMKIEKNKDKIRWRSYLEELTNEDKILNIGGNRYKFKICDDIIRELTPIFRTALENNKRPINEISQIKYFLESLVFAVNQPSRENLAEKIKEIIGNDFNLINDSIYNNFFTYMSDWMQYRGPTPKAHFLTSENLKIFFEEAKYKIASLVAIGPTSMSRKKIKNLQVTFINEVPELKDFVIGSSNEKPVFNFINPYDTLLSAIKVDQILDSVAKDEGLYMKDDSHIFTNLEYLSLISESLIKAFQFDGNDLFIVDCKPIHTAMNIKGLFKQLLEIMKKSSKKKIILITQPNDDLASEFKKCDKLIEKTDENNSICHLMHKPQEDLLDKKLIVLQGKEEKKSLNQLIVKFPLDIVDIKTFVDLITGKDINIGTELTDLGKINNYYIQRKFYLIEIKREIENDRAFPDRLVYTKSDFDRLCQEQPNSNIHWLKSEAGRLILQQSQGSVFALHKYILKFGRSLNNSYSESDLLDHISNYKVVIISDSAGMGKSTVLTSLSQQIKTKESKDSCKWVIRIDLIKFTSQLNKLKNTSSRISKNQAIYFLLNELLKLDDGLNKNVLEASLSSDSNNGMRVVILLDGFDEITPTYKDVVINLLNKLKETNVERLWITTRPDVGKDLESKLNVIAYDLKPFSKDQDQVNFLTKFWKQKFKEEKIDHVDEEILQIYAKELIYVLCRSTSGKLIEFTSIPLHIMIVADVFYTNKKQGEEKEWQGCKEFLYTYNIENKISSVLPNQFSISELYEHFVKTKFYDIHFQDKIGIDFTKPEMKEIFNKPYESFREKHQELALYTLLNHEDFRKLSYKSTEYINNLISDIKCGKENKGIIDQIIDKKPHFIHATFGEYFSSFPFTERIISDFTLTLECINNVLPNTSPIFINSIVDQFDDKKKTKVIASLGGKSLVNFVAQRGYLHFVQALLESGHDNFPQPDNLEKTPLHYACEGGHAGIIQYLLSHNNDILEENILEHGAFKREEYKKSKLVLFVNKEDTHLNTAVYYAAQNNEMEIASNLLLKGANCNKLKEHTSALALYVIEKVHSAYADQEHKLRPIVEKLLLQDPTSVSGLSLQYKFPRLLSYFFKHGRLEVIRAILKTVDNEKRKQLLNQDDNGITPLDRVNNSKELNDEDRLKIAKYLVENGGTKTKHCVGFEDYKSHYYTRILQAAARDGHIETFKHFISQESQCYYYLHLYQAVHNNQDNIQEYLYSHHPNDIIHEGNTALHTAVDSGANLRIIKYLIDKGEDVNARSERGDTPLFHAIYAHRKLAIIRCLIQHKADINITDNNGKTPLCYAIENEGEDFKDNLAQIDVDVIKYLLIECNSHIFECQRNQAEFFKSSNTYNLNSTDENGTPLLHAAIQSNDIEWSKFIIRKGGNVNLQDSNGKTPLHWASKLQQIEIVELLFQYGAMYCVVDQDGNTPYNLISNLSCLNEGGKKIIWLLDTLDELFNSTNLNQYLKTKLISDIKEPIRRNYGPYGICHSDASDTHNPVIFIFNARNAKNNSLLHLAINMNDKQTVYTLIKTNNFYLKEKKEGYSAYYRDYQSISINGIDEVGNMPLHIAAKKGLPDILYLLLDTGAIFNAQNKEGHTPKELANNHDVVELLQSIQELFDAVKEANRQKVEYCINKENYIDINIKDKDGKTVLHYASSSGNTGIIQLLLENDADMDSLDANYYTPLHFSVENDRTDAVKLLIKKGACFNIENKEGKSPLELAKNEGASLLKSINQLFIDIESEDPDITIDSINNLKFIQEKHNMNIDHIINVKDNQGNTILCYAAENGYLDIVKFLLQHGAMYNIVPEDSYRHKNTRDLLMLIHKIFENTNHIHEGRVDMKIITNVRNNKGRTLLHLASREGNSNVVITLLNLGASIDAEDIDNKRAFDYVQEEHVKIILERTRDLFDAVLNNDASRLHSLITDGAVIGASTHGGNTPLHIATKHGLVKMVKKLLTYAKNIDDDWSTFRRVINATNNDGQTAFSIAKNKIEMKEVIKELLDQANKGKAPSEIVNLLGDLNQVL